MQTFDIDMEMNSLSNYCQEALNQIGKYKRTTIASSDRVILEGNTRYGLQTVKLFIQLDKIDGLNTKLLIDGSGDDIFDLGVQKSIEKFIERLQLLIANIDSTSVKVEEVNRPVKNLQTIKAERTGANIYPKIFGVLAFIIIFFFIKSIILSSGISNKCDYCNGKGKSDCIYCVRGTTSTGHWCTFCNARGWEVCTFCNGTGKK